MKGFFDKQIPFTEKISRILDTIIKKYGDLTKVDDVEYIQFKTYLNIDIPFPEVKCYFYREQLRDEHIIIEGEKFQYMFPTSLVHIIRKRFPKK